MKLIFSEQAWEDYCYWQDQDRKLVQCINGLLKECVRTPFTGTGKPEPLRGSPIGWWSRRTNLEHRLVYKPTADRLLVAQCRYHY